MKRKRLILAALTAPLLLLAACGEDHPGEHCAASHSETGLMPITMSCGQNCITTTVIPYTYDVCDQWVPDDPSTVKPEGSK